MATDLWINLPVKNVDRAKEFFGRIGFAVDERRNGSEMACLSIGEKQLNVLLFPEEIFKRFSGGDVADSRSGAEVLLSVGAASREAVDETARKVWDAGGRVFSEPQEKEGWMYGCGFADLDGHRWNVVYMDFAKMPQG